MSKKYIHFRNDNPILYIFQFIYSLYVNIEFYHKKQKNIAIGTIIAAIINIVLNFVFIPIFGYVVAAYTTLIGYFCLLIIHFLFVRKMKCTNWYDTKFFMKVSIFAICSVVLFNILYKYSAIRYIVIIIVVFLFGILSFKNRKLIFRCIKEKTYQPIYDNLIEFTKRSER